MEVAFEILIHAGFLANSRVMMFFMLVDCAYNIVHRLVSVLVVWNVTVYIK